MNFIQLIFSLLTVLIIIFGSLLNTCENKLPAVFVKTFRYGKFAYRGQVTGILSKIVVEVSKSGFKHFYWPAVIIYSYVLWLTTYNYIFEYDIPIWIIKLLNGLCGERRIAYTSATKTYIAVCLMSLQVFRRFYDTHFVSIFGKNSYINMSQYLIGLFHYQGCALAMLSEAPNFARNSSSTSTVFNMSKITYMDILAIVLFMWAWWHQHVTTKILANLRKNKKGDVVSNDHKLPHGDWFEYLSAPHQTAEILMYISITILLRHNITWFFVFAWVLCNQVETILLTHWWYQDTFEKFPKERKALIPFLY